MTWFKRILIAVAGLAGVLAAALWWVLGTNSGLHFALDRVVAATGGAVSLEQARGSLAGPLHIKGLRYADGQGTSVTVDKATLDVAIWPLLGRTLRVDALNASGIRVHLPASSPSEPETNTAVSLKPPLGIVIADARVEDLDVRRGDESLFAANSIVLAGSWTDEGIGIKTLRLRAPDGQADASGSLVLGPRYQGQGQLDFAWKRDSRQFAGSLKARSDGSTARASVTLTKPMAANIQLQLQQERDYPWRVDVKLPRGDAAPLLGKGDIQTLAADLHASGSRKDGRLEGTLHLNDWPLSIQPLEVTLGPDDETVQIHTLELVSKRVPGHLQANGEIALNANPMTARLDVSWADVQLPAELAGQKLATHGRLKASGSLDDYQATGQVNIGPPDRLANLSLDIRGDRERLGIHTLTLKQPQGSAKIAGTVTFQPALRWDIQVEGQQFDPGQLLAGWDGALNFRLASRGRHDRGLDATIAIDQLDGRLRQRAVSGQGKLHLSAAKVLDGKLKLAMGQSHVNVRANPGSRNDIHVDLDVASLGDWLPDSAGSLNGTVRLRGKLENLALESKLDGKSLRWQQNRVGSLHLDTNVPDLASPGGRFEIQAGEARLAGLDFDSVNLDANGTTVHHSVTLNADGRQLKLKLMLEGRMPKSTWQGQLTTLDLEPQGMPPWRLAGTVPIRIGPRQIDVAELCLTAGDPRICAQAHQKAGGALNASYSLQAVPIQLLAALVPEQSLPISAEGVIVGQGKLERSAAGVLSGHAEVHSDEGSVTWLDSPESPLLGWTALRADADFSGQKQSLEIHARLTQQGTLDGRLDIAGAQQALDGHLELDLDSLAFAGLLSPDLANVDGALRGQVRIGGTLANPAVSGQARVRGFAAEIPALGLKLNNGQLQASTSDVHTVELGGSVDSGEGQLTVGGHVGIGANASTDVTLKGARFMAANIPAAKVTISPELKLEQDGSGVHLGGSLKIDSADVNAEKLPGAGTTQASPDVVVMDAPRRDTSVATPVSADVAIELGDHTHLKGFGMDGSLRGKLVVQQRPGRAPVGQGQIQVDGTYHAYGQDLNIERGQLLFASTPLANPGLDIRAIRRLNPNATIDEGQQVGLQISGTAMRPVLTVFSNPTMSQSDALSYLVTGKPLSQVKGGEGNMVGAAAKALGSATGDLLAKSIGSKLGVDEIGVSSNQALGGNAAFTVGKYLSPRLYMTYGVGLFEPGTVITLRYILSSRWNVEATQATEFSRASFNYRYEK